MARKTYSEEQIGAALDRLRFNQGNLMRTCKETGIQRATLRMWANGKTPKHVNDSHIERSLATGASAQIADRLEAMTPKILDAAEAAMPEAKFKDLLIGAQIAIQNASLLRGGPTKRQETNIRVSLTGGFGLRELSAQVIEGEYKALPDGMHKTAV